LAGNPSGHNQTREGGDDDFIDGGNGNNTAFSGDACDDIIRGGKDTDTVEAGSGKDKIYGKGGPDCWTRRTARAATWSTAALARTPSPPTGATG
jgi:Ca2+-binding RTX toxin-like protein